ncbi:PepSY-like domain-containing protein [Pseudochryseolinea flava]|uniref:Putative beta-lactamase-inhibitor-like PepSY-like domain-containing protein n=1 Tax=Pseudochryseolinea flava TaxID=2059302 RepID=A0A364Y1V2_9BACT|nr:PepSY-like domain-containing protein [Pseudochryseolinea flava]RAW00845.1 hypothetical protein DQQ10_11410 [Pseudochryseolinea flava]
MNLKYTILVVMLLLTMQLSAQNIQQTEVPAVVQNAVKIKYPTITDIKWKLKDGEYRAEFKIDKRGHDVWVDKSGNITKLKQDISKNDLPEIVKTKIASEFKNFTIDDADKIEKEGVIYYQVKLKSGADERKVLLTSDGKIEKDKAKAE